MRVNSEYQREISALISGELKHREPELKGIVSVTEADVALVVHPHIDQKENEEKSNERAHNGNCNNSARAKQK